MKIHRSIEQGSAQWLQMRAGKVTASRVDQIIAPGTGKPRMGAMPASYRCELVAERIHGGPIDTEKSGWMERGNDLEAAARDALAWDLGVDIEQVGFLASDCGRYGASPDGVITEAAGCELKCPALKTHVGYLLDPEGLDKAYRLQTQTALWITGWPLWYLASYCPADRTAEPMPSLLVREVRPDAALFAVLDETIPAFADSVDAAVKKIAGMVNEEDFCPISGW